MAELKKRLNQTTYSAKPKQISLKDSRQSNNRKQLLDKINESKNFYDDNPKYQLNFSGIIAAENDYQTINNNQSNQIYQLNQPNQPNQTNLTYHSANQSLPNQINKVNKSNHSSCKPNIGNIGTSGVVGVGGVSGIRSAGVSSNIKSLISNEKETHTFPNMTSPIENFLNEKPNTDVYRMNILEETKDKEYKKLILHDFFPTDVSEPENVKILNNKNSVSYKLKNQKINLKNLLYDRIKDTDYTEFLKRELKTESDSNKASAIQNKLREIEHLNYLKYEDKRNNFIDKEYSADGMQVEFEKLERNNKIKEKIKDQVERLYNTKNNRR